MGTLRRDTELVGGMTSLHAGEVDSPHPKKWEPAQTFVLDVPIFFSLTLLAPSILWGVLRPWKPKFGAWLYSVSQVCLFFFFFYLLPSLPTSHFFYICFLQECAEVTHGPWNLEFGSPPSTLSLHLRLKSESEDKYPPPIHRHPFCPVQARKPAWRKRRRRRCLGI